MSGVSTGRVRESRSKAAGGGVDTRSLGGYALRCIRDAE